MLCRARASSFMGLDFAQEAFEPNRGHLGELLTRRRAGALQPDRPPYCLREVDWTVAAQLCIEPAVSLAYARSTLV
jgi:hypothetical protein